MPEPLEAQYYREYVTYSEVFRKKPTPADFEEKLRGTGLHSIMAGLSFINSVLYMKGTLRAQLELVNDTFTPDIKARIAQLPRLEVRALYSAAQILFVMKTAVLQSPDRNDE